METGKVRVNEGTFARAALFALGIMQVKPMPKCFYNIRDRNEYHRDTEGRDCDTIEHMEREAILTAAALAKDNAAKGLQGAVCVEVFDETGKMVAAATSVTVVQRINNDGFMT